MTSPDEESGRENLSSELLIMVEAMARAELVVITERREGREGARHRMVHYMTDYMIVEQVYEERQRYSLSRVADLTTAMLRIVSTVGVPESSPIGAYQVESNEGSFAGITEAVQAGESEGMLAELSQMGLDAVTAQGLVDAIAEPTRRGTVSVMQLDGRCISDARALAYFIREQTCWLVIKPDVNTSEVELQTATASTFWEVLVGYVGDLMPQTSAAG